MSEQALWVSPGRGELREVVVGRPGVDEVRVRTLHSGISRGTESQVFRGAVPPEAAARMRAPHQEGSFPGPVKYGYLNVGVVTDGVPDLLGRTVFCLYPHQSAYVVPAADVIPVPDGVPARRAVLAGTVETAVNALWDAAPLVGDRVAVVGAGMVGCAVARLLAGIPGVQVTLVDVDPERAAVAARLGVGFAGPDDVAGDRDLVVHTSATGAGLQLCLDLLAGDGEVIELSWYADTTVTLALGSNFHLDRLRIRGSQVGEVALARRHRRTRSQRLALALRLLRDPTFDVLLSGSSPFGDLPHVLAEIATGRRPALCHTISYQDRAEEA